MKITKEQKDESTEIYKSLISKAWGNPDFKEKLINNPKLTIEKFQDKKIVLPEDTLIVVDDQTDISKIYLNIPKKVNLDNFELSDEEMEMISGGIVGATTLAVIICVELIAIGYCLAEIRHLKQQ